MMSGWLWAELRASPGDGDMSKSGSLRRSCFFCQLVKSAKEIRGPSPHEHVTSLQKMSVTQEHCRWQTEPRVLAEWAVAFPTFRINVGLVFFFNLKISSFARHHVWHYRISYLSTRKVVSVENLTGLFPSTWVTLVTCMLQ